MSTYDKLEEGYNSHLMRGSELNMPTNTPESGNGGFVADVPVKNEGAMDDVWIKNFIRSQNWKAKTQGFTIDGRSGYAEFSGAYVRGDLSVSGTISGVHITGSTIDGTSITGGTIIGTTITGSTITTGSTGQYIKMTTTDANRIEFIELIAGVENLFGRIEGLHPYGTSFSIKISADTKFIDDPGSWDPQAPNTEVWSRYSISTSGTAGIAVTTTDNSLTDIRLSLTPNAYAYGNVRCNGKSMFVVSNTATTFTGTHWSGGGNPGNGFGWLADDRIGGVTLSGVEYGTFAIQRFGSTPEISGDTIFTNVPLFSNWNPYIDAGTCYYDTVDSTTGYWRGVDLGQSNARWETVYASQIGNEATDSPVLLFADSVRLRRKTAAQVAMMGSFVGIGINTTTTDTTLTDVTLTMEDHEYIAGTLTCNGKTMVVRGNNATTFFGSGWSGGGNPGNGHAWTFTGVINDGMMVYNSDDDKFYVRAAGVWKTLAYNP